MDESDTTGIAESSSGVTPESTTGDETGGMVAEDCSFSGGSFDDFQQRFSEASDNPAPNLWAGDGSSGLSGLCYSETGSSPFWGLLIDGGPTEFDYAGASFDYNQETPIPSGPPSLDEVLYLYGLGQNERIFLVEAQSNPLSTPYQWAESNSLIFLFRQDDLGVIIEITDADSGDVFQQEHTFCSFSCPTSTDF